MTENYHSERRASIDPEVIAHKAAEAAVKNVFAHMGVNVDVPSEMEEFRKDLRLAGQLRKASEKGFMLFLYTGISLMVAAGFYGIYGRFNGGT